MTYLQGLPKARVLSGQCSYDHEKLLLENERELILGGWRDYICPKCERHYRITITAFTTDVQEWG